MSTYLEKFNLVSEFEEMIFVRDLKMTCYSTVYPFKIFDDNRIDLTFEPITIFYGSNGSGKSTLLNIIAEKTMVRRNSPFNSSAFFSDYVERCSMKTRGIPMGSRIMTSDDVFDYILDVRNINRGVDNKRNEYISEYINYKADRDHPFLLQSLDQFDEWKKAHRIRSGKQSASAFVRENMNNNIDMHSNGENAMIYFVDTIQNNALYLLDEPENSLSVEYQLELKKFLEDSARYFNCQLIITTHSPVLLAIKGAKVYDLDSDPIQPRKWTELENVRRYFDFFEKHREEFYN